MKTAWLYAGQGSQSPGMGRDFYDAFPEIRDIFNSPAAGFDLRKMCFDAEAEMLSRTRFTQPCMAAFALAVTRLLKNRGFFPDCAAGLSLGEYSALHAAGVFEPDAILSLLAFRGIAMERSAEGVKSRMSAVLGLSEELVRQGVAAAQDHGAVSCTNINCPGQIVIGGEENAVLRAEKNCLELGAKRCLALNTSGPFHTPLMENASAELEGRFKNEVFALQEVPVIFNTTGEPANDADIPQLLCAQVKSTVLFEKTIRTLAGFGVTDVIEIGPGRALAGFVRKTAPEMRVVSIEKVEDLEKL